MKKFTLLIALGLTTQIYAQGCLEAPNGQWPEETIVPVVNNYPYSVDERFAGEYTVIQVTADRLYTFTSTEGTDFITISDEAGATILTFGTGSLEWIPDFEGNIRFYVHIDSECNWDDEIYRNRSVKFNLITEPDYNCDQDYRVYGNVGMGIDNSFSWYVANDFFVPMESEMYALNTIAINLSTAGFTFPENPTFDVSILNDNEGTPGTVITTFSNLAPILVEPSDNQPNRWLATFGLGGYQLDVNPDTDTRYWLSLTSYAGEAIYWIGAPHNDEWLTRPGYQSQGGEEWVPHDYFGAHSDCSWTIDATCELLATEDMNSTIFTYYPNPVNDYLVIETEQAIEDISIYNLAGQAILHGVQADNGRVDMQVLASGFYVVKLSLEGGQTETFKVIKN